jgi:hypothetical protein
MNDAGMAAVLADFKHAVHGLPVEFTIGACYIKVWLDGIECGAVIWGSDDTPYAAVITGREDKRGIFPVSNARRGLVLLVNAGIDEKIDPVVDMQGNVGYI